MPDPQTPNLGLYIPLNGADVGTWDVPVNANMTLLDGILGASGSVVLNNVNIVLSPAQYNLQFISFTGTLTGNVEVQFPPISRSYLVYNACLSGTSFYIRCYAVAGNAYVALPPNEVSMIVSDGVNMRFVGLGRVGTYWDFAGSAVPLWVSNSNPAPYLNCDGTAFSSAAYPALRDYLGGATLPDARGRYRATLNQGTARLNSGNVILNGYGSETITQGNLPNYNLTGGAHQHIDGYQNTGVAAGTDFTGPVIGPPYNNLTQFSGSLSIPSGGSGAAYAQPAYIGGLTLIRAG